MKNLKRKYVVNSRWTFSRPISVRPLILIAAVASLFFLNTTVSLKAQEGPQPESAERIISRLMEMRDDSSFFKELKEAYMRTEDPIEALDLMHTFLPVLEENSERHTLLIDMARLEEQIGRLQSAQLHFQSAAFAGDNERDYAALYHSVLLLIELGDLNYAKVQAEQILSQNDDSLLNDRVKVQLARIAQLEGDFKGALNTAEELYIRRASLGAEVLYSLWIVYTLLPDRYPDRRDGAENLKEELRKRFPKSPEFGLITEENSPVPTVELSLGLRGPSPEEKEEDGEDSVKLPAEEPTEIPDLSAGMEEQKEGEKSTAIQTGSFRDAENAHYMQKTLEKEGFTAMVTQAQIGQSTYFRVLIPIPFGASEEEIILQLKEKGFEGYPVY